MRSHPRRRRPEHGFTLIDLMIAAVILVVATLLGVMHVTTSVRELVRSRESGFARQRAVSILAELRAYVEGDEGHAASELDEFDDGTGWSPTLTTTPDRTRASGLVDPDHPMSGNDLESGTWAWSRRIRVQPLATAASRDLRRVTVSVYRARADMPAPGERMAEVSTVIRTLGDAYPTAQVYDVYVLALENAPGWWVSTDVMQPFFQAALADIQARNPGLQFRTHWITKLGYGRDEEYAPYVNEDRVSTDPTPWAYVYPGRLPAGSAALRYYVAGRMQGRLAERSRDEGVNLPADRQLRRSPHRLVGGFARPRVGRANRHIEHSPTKPYTPRLPGRGADANL